MSCENCHYRQALSIAKEITTENPNHLFDRRRQEQKISELLAIDMVFSLVQPECSGEKEDGKCGQALLINDTRNFLLGNPEVHISANNQATIGFSNE